MSPFVGRTWCHGVAWVPATTKGTTGGRWHTAQHVESNHWNDQHPRCQPDPHRATNIGATSASQDRPTANRTATANAGHVSSVAYPIAAFARIVTEDPALQATYGNDAVRYANAVMQTMSVFMPQMHYQRVGNVVEGYIAGPDANPPVANVLRLPSGTRRAACCCARWTARRRSRRGRTPGNSGASLASLV